MLLFLLLLTNLVLRFGNLLQFQTAQTLDHGPTGSLLQRLRDASEFRERLRQKKTEQPHSPSEATSPLLDKEKQLMVLIGNQPTKDFLVPKLLPITGTAPPENLSEIVSSNSANSGPQFQFFSFFA
jgi:hypothetical protein